MFHSRFEAYRRDERGAALVSVLVLGGALVAVSGLMTLRTTQQTDDVYDDRGWEHSIMLAEGGIDIALDEIAADFEFHTGDYSASLAGKEDIVAIADAKPDGAVMHMPEGDVVVVKPQDAEEIYAVGYSPSRDAARRQVRVVEVEYAIVSAGGSHTGWVADYALLAGGDIIIQGNPNKIQGEGASVHANGDLDVRSDEQIDGCAFASGSSNYSGCGSGGVPEASIPVVDPLDAWHLSMYDMCPDGLAHFGPAHSSASVLQLPDDGPCSGSIVGDNQGWSGGAGRTWIPSDAPGVFYVHGGDVSGTVGRDHSDPALAVEAETTIIAAKADNSLGCTSTAPGGTIDLTAQFNLVGHPSAEGLTVVAGRDVRLRGGGRIEGLVLAHEWVDYAGNATVYGAVIAEQACDDHEVAIEDYPVVITGAAAIHWEGPIATPFEYIDEGAGTIPQITYIGLKETD